MSVTTNFQPLYRQVYDLLVARLVDGKWKLAEPLPSEFALAAELGVSQGTVRKALNKMEAENLLVRRQGKGTFVAEHTQESSLFRFFRYREPGDDSTIPETEVLGKRRRMACEHEANALALAKDLNVVETMRLRHINGRPAIYEMVLQPLSIFPDIDKETNLPNSLYTLYQEKYGVSIVEVRDELRAVNLDEEKAKYLDVSVNSPALMTERSSINIEGRVVEWSQAFCTSEYFVYSVNIR